MNLTINNAQDHELLKSIKNGESTTIEFKLRLSSVEKMAKEICAFANTKGGKIITGVDDTGNVIGVDSYEETETVFIEAINLLEPRPEIRISRHRLDGRLIVVGLVSRGEKKPYRVFLNSGDSSVYIRLGSTIHPLTRKQIKQLGREDQVRKKIRITQLQQVMLDDISKNKSITISELAHRHNLSVARTSCLLVPMLRSGMIVKQGHGKQSRYQVR
ncbi:MAG: ATP-binding protein [Deltaproteobacteria bacterium]|nr:ATP-binding protein [Deltaproteobacteria bacterium]